MIHLWNILVEPEKVFAHIKEKNDWWIPFIFVVVITMITLWIKNPAVQNLTRQMLEERGMTGELPEFTKYIRYVSVPVMTMIGWLAMSFVIWITANGFGADMDYIKSLDLFAYGSVVVGVGEIIKVIILAMRGFENIATFRDLHVATGLDLFFQPQNHRLFALLSSINVFQIWLFILVAFGISEITGISKKKSTMVAITVFIINLLLSVFLSRKGIY